MAWSNPGKCAFPCPCQTHPQPPSRSQLSKGSTYALENIQTVCHGAHHNVLTVALWCRSKAYVELAAIRVLRKQEPTGHARIART